MQDEKIEWNKKDGILAFHFFQSFKEGEVTPELAHQIGLELANKMWGDKEKHDKYYPVTYELYGKNILNEE